MDGCSREYLKKIHIYHLTQVGIASFENNSFHLFIYFYFLFSIFFDKMIPATVLGQSQFIDAEEEKNEQDTL